MDPLLFWILGHKVQMGLKRAAPFIVSQKFGIVSPKVQSVFFIFTLDSLIKIIIFFSPTKDEKLTFEKHSEWSR